MTAGSPRRDIRRVIAPIFVLTMAIATALWGFPEGVGVWRSSGIVLGWAGTGMLVASLALMIRQPRYAAWLGGLDNLYRWHHRSGTLAYALLAAHPIALAVEGWKEAPLVAWQTIAPWPPAMPVATGWIALLLLMLGLATTFSMRLPYRRWRGCHYLLALAVACGLVHVYLLLTDVLPALLLGSLAFAAVGWRLLASDLGLGALPYRVTAVEHRASHVVEATLAPCAVPLQAAVGQFVLAAFDDGPHFRGCGEFHPFTVSAITPDHTLRIAIKALGACTQNVQNLEPGVLVRVQGPFGSFLDGRTRGPQLWIAGGIGITPFMAALRGDAIPQPTTLIYLFRSETDAPFLDELRQIAAASTALQLITDASGRAPPDLARVLAQVPDIEHRQVSICGPAALVELLRARLQALGVAAGNIHFESFDFR